MKNKDRQPTKMYRENKARKKEWDAHIKRWRKCDAKNNQCVVESASDGQKCGDALNEKNRNEATNESNSQNMPQHTAQCVFVVLQLCTCFRSFRQ